jgi:rhamnulose-1-phosphate aldolase
MKSFLPKSEALDTILSELSRGAQYLWDKVWIEGTGGNISINLSDHVSPETWNRDSSSFIHLEKDYPNLSGCTFLVTGTGKRLRDLALNTEENTCLITVAKDGKGYYLYGGKSRDIRPTSEFNSHLSIYQLLIQQNRPKQVILHTHPNALIALTHIFAYTEEESLNRLLQTIHPEVRIFIPEGVGLVPYFRPGSEELAEATVKAFATHNVVIWEKHGCLGIGKDIFEAFDLIDMVNKAAQIYFMCKSTGSLPQGLTDAQLRELDR